MMWGSTPSWMYQVAPRHSWGVGAASCAPLNLLAVDPYLPLSLSYQAYIL